MYNIHLLPATFGDSILVEYGTEKDKHYILIDGGPYYNFNELWSAMQNAAPDITELELIVVTHIDIDHIDGIVKLLNQSNLPFGVKQIWFNGKEQLEKAVELLRSNDYLGPLQGEYLTLLIKDNGYLQNDRFPHGIVCVTNYNDLPKMELTGGMSLQLLSPGLEDLSRLAPEWDEEVKGLNIQTAFDEDKRYRDDMLGDKDKNDEQGLDIEKLLEQTFENDKSAANCSSIAFIGTFDGKRCLFAADSPSQTLLAAINPLLKKEGKEKLEVDAWKLAHHGSKKSTQDSLMEKISAKHILVSSDGKRYKHPDAPVIAKLLKHGSGNKTTFHFNYRTDFNKDWDNEDLKDRYKYDTAYPATNDFGITIKL